jgi:signal transduction histidine kinase
VSDGVRWWRSLRFPIAVVVALSAVTVALAFGLVADRNTMSDGVARLRDEAKVQLNAATTTYEFTNTLLSDATLTGGKPPGSAPLALIRAATGNAIATYFDGTTMWAANAVSDRQVLVTRVPAGALLQERRDLHQSLLYVGLATLVLAGLGGWLVSGTLTGRLRRAARWVEVGAETAPVEADLIREGDEVGELVARIDRLSTTLRDRVRTEQAFTADVAHELRTPLTALVSAAELLSDADPATPLVRHQVGRLRALVDELLELARADQTHQPLELEAVDVMTVLADIAAQMPDLTPDAVVVDGGTTVLAEPQRLERILVNVLANAHLHGARPVNVAVADGRVVIRDSGSGLPDELVSSGPQRLRSMGRTAGAGLGLALAQTFCAQMGGALTFSNAEGAEVTLALQQPPRNP